VQSGGKGRSSRLLEGYRRGGLPIRDRGPQIQAASTHLSDKHTFQKSATLASVKGLRSIKATMDR